MNQKHNMFDFKKIQLYALKQKGFTKATVFIGFLFGVLVVGWYVFQSIIHPFIAQGQSASLGYCIPGDPCAGPVAHWPIDELTGGQCVGGGDICDISGGGNHGSTPNTNWKSGTECMDGICLRFAGAADQKITISNESNFDFEVNEPFSISAWINTTSTFSQAIFSKLSSSWPYSGYFIYIFHSGSVDYVYFLIYAQGQYLYIGVTPPPIIDGKWHHIVSTYDGSGDLSGLKVYVDGVEAQRNNWYDTVTTQSMLNNTVPQIGEWVSGYYFRGKIDDVRVFDYERMPEQVFHSYKVNKPVMWWTMNDGLNTPTACDGEVATVAAHVGSANGALNLGTLGNTTPSVAWSAGANKCSLSFDGVDDSVLAGDTGLGGTVRSLSFWVNYSGAGGRVIDLDNGATYVYITTAPDMVRAQGLTAPQFYVDGVKTQTITPNVWHHVALSSAAAFNPSNVTFGSGGGSFLNGKIDDIRMYQTTWGPAIPVVTVGYAPASFFLDDNFSIRLDFDNTGESTGYAPFIDIIYPQNGADGVSTATEPFCSNRVGTPNACDGVTFINAQYSTQPLFTYRREFPYTSSKIGCVNHPLAVTTGGAPAQICGASGDALVVIEVPFAAIAANDPHIYVSVSSLISDLADAGYSLPLRVRGGFQLGSDSFNNPSADPSIFGDFVTLNVAPNPLALIFSYNGADQEIVAGVNYKYIYTTGANIADGQTVKNLVITDILSNALIYDSFILANPPGYSILQEPVVGFPQNPPFNDLVVSWAGSPAIVGTDNSLDGRMDFQFYVSDINASGAKVVDTNVSNCTMVQSDYQYVADWYPLDTRDSTSTIPSALGTHNIEVCAFSLSKSGAIQTDNAPAGVSPGDVVQYSLNFSLGDYYGVTEIVVNDTFSDGQLIDLSFDPILQVTMQGVTTNAQFNAANYSVVRDSPGTGQTNIVFRVSDELQQRSWNRYLIGGCVPSIGGAPDCSTNSGPTTAAILFRTIIQQAYTDSFIGTPNIDQGDQFSNSATAQAEHLDVETLLSTSNSFNEGSIPVTLRIESGVLSDKTIYAIDGILNFSENPSVSPGDVITYRLVYNNPTSDIESLVIKDYLPDPFLDAEEVAIFDNSPPNADVPPAGVAKFGPTDTFFSISNITPSLSTNAVQNIISFEYGTYQTAVEQQSTIDLLFSVTVTDTPFADEFLFNNRVISQEGSSFGSVGESNQSEAALLVQPLLKITKGIVATNNPDSASVPETAGPVAFSAPGGQCPRFSDQINSTNIADSATPIKSDLVAADAGDIITFVMVLENIGDAPDGAFDVQFKDVLPPQLVAPSGGENVCVTNGNGTPLPYVDLGGGILGNGIELIDPGGVSGSIPTADPSNGLNMAVISYDARITSAVSAAQAISNKGVLFHYAGSEGGPDHTLEDKEDSALISISLPTMIISIDSTSEAHTGFVSGYERLAIGEVVRIRYKIRIPEGTHPLVSLTAAELFGGFIFLNDGTAVFAFVSNGPGISTSKPEPATHDCTGVGPRPRMNFTGDETNIDTIEPECLFTAAELPGPYNPGTWVEMPFGDVKNFDDDGDFEYIIVEANYILHNSGSINAGDDSLLIYAYLQAAGNFVVGNIVEAYVVKPNLTVNKTVQIQPGDSKDIYKYTYFVKNNTGTNRTDIFDLRVSDTVTPSNKIKLLSVSSSTSFGVAPDTSGTNYPNYNGIITLSSLPTGQSMTIDFKAEVKAVTRNYQRFDSSTLLTYTSLPGPRGTLVNPTGSETPGNSGAVAGERNGDTTTAWPNNYYVARNNNYNLNDPTVNIREPERTSYTIGDQIDYTLIVDIPEGEATELKVQDALPLGLAYIPSSLEIIQSAADSAGLLIEDFQDSLPGYTLTALGNGGDDVEVSFNQPVKSKSDNNPNNNKFLIKLSVRVLNEKGNPLSSSVLVNEGNVNGTILVNNAQTLFREPNSESIRTVQDPSPISIEIVEPVILLDKFIVEPPLPPQAGESITYAAVFQHHPESKISAFDVTFEDALPAELVNPQITLFNASGTFLPSAAFDGNTLRIPPLSEPNTFDLPANLVTGTYCLPGDPNHCAIPVAHWAMQEGQDAQCNGGKDVCDKSGNNLHGMRVGAAWVNDESRCINGVCMYFDGVDDRISVPDNALIDLTDDFTISAWVYPIGPGSDGVNGGIIVNKENVYKMGRKANGIFQWAFNAPPDPTWTWKETGEILPLNKRTHVVVSFSPSPESIIRTYVNGALVHTYDGSGVVNKNNNELWIGSGAGQFFHGYIDDVRIYDYQRTIDQIRYEYAQALLPASEKATAAIVFTADLYNDFLPGDTVTNRGEVRWTSIKGNSPNERTGEDAFYRSFVQNNDYRMEDTVIFYSTVCSKLFQGQATNGYCTASQQCNLRPIAGIVIEQAGDPVSKPFIFSGVNSVDDITPLGQMKVRWDFDYDGVVPTWDVNEIFLLDDFANEQFSHQYTAYGQYRVLLQVRDLEGITSFYDMRYITINPPGTGRLSILPKQFPATNLQNHYNFGITGVNNVVSIDMLICNLGSVTIDVTGFSITGINADKFSYSLGTTTPPITLFSDPKLPVDCSPTNAATSWENIRVSFNPANEVGSFLADFEIVSTENPITVHLQGSSRTGAGVSGSTPSESVIYDGRTLINPPPGFIEFLDKIRFVQPVKPR